MGIRDSVKTIDKIAGKHCKYKGFNAFFAKKKGCVHLVKNQNILGIFPFMEI
jgi:hypothetical protein